MSIGALSTAFQGLNAAQQELQLISVNVANASTPGYTRKTLGLNSVILNGQQSGVQVGAITRATDPTLQFDLWQQNSISSAATTNQSYLNQVQQLFGTPSSNTSVSASLTALQGDFVSLSADPGNGVLQTQVVNDAQNVASQYNKLSGNIQQLRNSAQTDISNNLGQVNSLLKQIAGSNAQIVALNNTAGDATSVEDQRDQAIQQLSQYMNISTYSNADGSVTVQTSTGTLLADTQAQQLQFTQIPQTASSAYPSGASGITINGTDISSQITSGSVGQLLALRDTVLPQAQAMIDQSSYQLASRFNAQGVKLFTDGAGNIPANDPTSSSAGYLGFSGVIQVNSAVVGTPSLIQQGTGGGPALDSGDNTNVLKVLDYTFGSASDSSGTAQTFATAGLGANGNITLSLPSTGNITSYTQDIISTLAQSASQATSNQTYQQSYAQTLTENFQNTTGVSIDTEMTNMISVQQAYQANARMISTVSDMYNELLAAIPNS